MYSDKVMDHFTNPRNVGEIPDADGVGEVGNEKCGDIMRIYLKIDNNVITDVKFIVLFTVFPGFTDASTSTEFLSAVNSVLRPETVTSFKVTS